MLMVYYALVIDETGGMARGESQKLIVIVEDDPLYGRMLGHQLGSLGYVTRLFTSGEAFLGYLPSVDTWPDLFIFDYFLGHDEPTGLTLCRKVRSHCNLPVLMLTGNNKLEALVSCLKAGADHYIVKPCDIRELDARIVASLRKSSPLTTRARQGADIAFDGGLLLNWREHVLIGVDGSRVQLSEKECGLLEMFISASDGCVDRDNAFQVLYGYPMAPNNRSIDVLVSKLRKKLTELDPAYRIKPMRAKGYALFRAMGPSEP